MLFYRVTIASIIFNIFQAQNQNLKTKNYKIDIVDNNDNWKWLKVNQSLSKALLLPSLKATIM